MRFILFLLILSGKFCVSQNPVLTKYIYGRWIATKAVTPDLKEIKKDNCGNILIPKDTLDFLDNKVQNKNKHYWKAASDSVVQITHHYTKKELELTPALASIGPMKYEIIIDKLNSNEFIAKYYGSECGPFQYYLLYKRIK